MLIHAYMHLLMDPTYIQDIIILTFSECFQSQFWVYNQLVHVSSTGHQEYDVPYHLTQIYSIQCTNILTYYIEAINTVLILYITIPTTHHVVYRGGGGSLLLTKEHQIYLI